MKYIHELKSGTGYFYKNDNDTPEEWLKISKFVNDRKENRKSIPIKVYEEFLEWFDKEYKILFFENLEEESLPGYLWTCYGVPSINMMVASVTKIGENVEKFKMLSPCCTDWPPMEDWRFGIEDRNIDRLIHDIQNMPDDYRKKL